jgi:hypothetical protein
VLNTMTAVARLQTFLEACDSVRIGPKSCRGSGRKVRSHHKSRLIAVLEEIYHFLERY